VRSAGSHPLIRLIRMQSTWKSCVVSLGAFLLCTVVLPFQAQQPESIKTESDLIVALAKANKAQGETSKVLETHASLVTVNLWDQLMALASQMFYRNPEKAFVLYDCAREVALHLKDQRRLATTYYNIARSYSGLRQYENATSNYLESKKAFEIAGFERDVIYVLAELGMINWVQERYAEARQYSEASISLAESLKSGTTPTGAWPDVFGIAESLLTLGQLSARDGDVEQAIAQLMRGLALLHELNSDHSYNFYITEICAALGRVYTSAGDHIKALHYLNSALKTATAAQIPNVLNSLGYLYMEQEDYAQADAQFHEGLKIYRSANNQREVSRVLLNLGVIQQRQGNYDQALVLFRQSLDIATATKVVDVEIAALEGIGVVLTAQARFDDALKALNKGLTIARETQDKMRQTELLWRTAQTYQQMKEYARAEQFSQDAVAIARAMHLPKLSFLAMATLGDVYAANKKTELAIKTLKDSIDQLETLRDRVAGREEGLELFFENKLGPYHSLVTLLSAQGKNFEALLYAERAKGRALLDAVSSGKADLASVLTENERIEERHLLQKISEINQRLKSQPAEDTRTQNELYSQLDAARLELASFEDRTYVAHPELRLRSGVAQALTLASLKTLTASSDLAYLEYVATDRKLGAFIVKRNRLTNEPDIRYLNLPVNADELRQKVNQFHSMLATRHPNHRPLSRELYHLLIEPVVKELQDVSTISIVPDGFLWTLPFQALTTQRGKCLVEQYALYYAPSLSVLHEMNDRTRQTSSNRSLIAFGNPVIGRDEKLNQDLCPLPEAETEVAEVAATVPSKLKRVLVGRDADEKSFKTLAPAYSTIHLATHGVLDNRDPLYSHLLLTKTDGDVENDGSLEAREIMNMRLNADLAVLSACETGNGRISPGEGVIGISWAFFVAGTRSMVVSEWRVNSTSTSQLMKNFYQALARQPNRSNKAQALKEASVSLRKDVRYRHPFYWAGFVLVGNN
jgi:CHAT domain-containing protein/tetratricopeptide (TPR) repeat protein